ncbi:flagellar basal-body rod protein FlgF [Pseudomaricurvus sp.]|uniref:flagellar basal-body rod protein FlgF n=1 Tax=Pseudomaricurvus sp. TaxID=2004510 RepID=UPI003F6B190D
MDKALYISMTGAKHNMMAQAVHANNLANANTNGFRADFAQARSMPVYNGEGYPTRAYALTENPATDFSQGPLIQTGNDLDFAIEGEGFVAVQGLDGAEAYTRSASLQITAQGQLLTGNGLPVLGDGGPVFVPPNSKIDIGVDGTITTTGDTPLDQAQLDRLRLVKPDIADLVKGEDGLFRQKDGNLAPVDGSVRIQSGFVEGSNVNTISEFTNVMALSRQYELSVKMMKTVQGNSEASARLLQG